MSQAQHHFTLLQTEGCGRLHYFFWNMEGISSYQITKARQLLTWQIHWQKEKFWNACLFLRVSWTNFFIFYPTMPLPFVLRLFLLWNQIRGGSRPKLKGGQFGEGAPKTQWKISAPKARENFWGFIRENSLVFLLNNDFVYMFRRIQNESLKKDCIWVRIRGAFLAKKGAPKLNFHREGGAVAPICPP